MGKDPEKTGQDTIEDQAQHGACRHAARHLRRSLAFITNRAFRETHGSTTPVLFWLNLNSKSGVDELFAQWKAAQAKIVLAPEDKPWKLREFIAADPDGNLIRVFYDFRGDV